MSMDSAPSAKAVLELAEKMTVSLDRVCASDYVDAIHALRKKGYTWVKIKGWFDNAGFDFSKQAIASAYYNSKYYPPKED